MGDGPVYQVYPESDGDRNPAVIRTLHRNLLHLVNDLPVDLPPQSVVESRRPKEKKQGLLRSARKSEEVNSRDSCSDDSDTPRAYYWLRST